MNYNRLRLAALEEIAVIVSDMGSSPVENVAAITRSQIEIFAEYVSRIKYSKSQSEPLAKDEGSAA